MFSPWIRRAAGVLLVAATALLAACGSGSVVSDLVPQRFITVGDGFADVGQNGYRYTINDGSPSDNEMRFCCFCGKPLVEIRFEDEHE